MAWNASITTWQPHPALPRPEFCQFLIHHHQQRAAQIAPKPNRPEARRSLTNHIAPIAKVQRNDFAFRGWVWSLHCVQLKVCNTGSIQRKATSTAMTKAWCEQCKVYKMKQWGVQWCDALNWQQSGGEAGSLEAKTMLSNGFFLLLPTYLCCLHLANPFVDLQVESRCSADRNDHSWPPLQIMLVLGCWWQWFLWTDQNRLVSEGF